MAIIFDIKHFAIGDGDGIRTTVFFKGCPLRCKWCHNPEGINPKIEKFRLSRKFDEMNIFYDQFIGREITTEELWSEIEKDIPFFENSNGGGVTFSGGEPLMQIDALISILTVCKKNSLHTAVDTSGYASTSNFNILINSKLVDLILFDIKPVSKSLHIESVGEDNKIIIENLLSLKNSNIRTILRLPMIPNYTFTEDNKKRLLSLLAEVKCSNISEISLLPFHNNAKGKCSKYEYKYNMPDKLESLKKEELIPFGNQLKELGWSVNIG